MKFVDMHCDTLMNCVFNPEKYPTLRDMGDAMVDFNKMAKGDQLAQFFAVFVPPRQAFERYGRADMSNMEYIKLMSKALYENVEKNSDLIKMAFNATDIEANAKEGKMSAILTMEDGVEVNGKFENIDMFYDMGFRAVALTWNFVNCFGSPNSLDEKVMMAGLTDFGKEAIPYMQDKGIIVDVSHLSEGGFYDVAKYSKKPFIASHSNCRAVSPHQRNLTDDQIKVLANAGGVSGINFCPAFINADVNDEHCTIEGLVTHIKHFVNVGGIDVVGLGTDFDGIGGDLEIGNSSQMPMLEDALRKEGFTTDMIEKVFYKNAMRVIKESMK